MGLNLRIYNLKKSDVIDVTLNPNLKSDVWRDIDYYNYVNNNILKLNHSPNFVNIITYRKDTISKIRYSELDTIDKLRSQTK